MIQPRSRAELRAWLEGNHAASAGVWLATHKKATGKPRLDYDEIVEEALSFRMGGLEAEFARRRALVALD